jgi:predicted MPP superfamily phosphohydrolase
MLVNESVRLRGVLPIVGLDDLRAGRPDVRRATQGISPDEAQIVLCHNPRLLPRLADRNCFVIAGHTHGGQVHLPGTRFRRRPHDMHFAVWHEGWYRYYRAQMFVSVGVGSVSFPMRFACPPEIPIFTLKRA